MTAAIGPRLADYAPRHVEWTWADRVATLRLARPERKNPLTFESYAELRDLFRALAAAEDVDVVVFAPKAARSARAGMCARSSGR